MPPRRAWILRCSSIFSIFAWAGFITSGIRALDSRVSLLQTGHHGIFAITFFFCGISDVEKKNSFEKKSRWTSDPNFRAFHATFAEIRSEEVGLFCRLLNYNPNRWPGENHHNFLSGDQIEISSECIERGWTVVSCIHFFRSKGWSSDSRHVIQVRSTKLAYNQVTVGDFT